jgi:hypothetical protein
MDELWIEVRVPFFGWTPLGAVRTAAEIYRCMKTDCERDIFDRLMYTDEMRLVWREVLAEDRLSDGLFKHQVISGAISALGPKLAQERACGYIFKIAFCAARDRIQVSKDSENNAVKKALLDDLAACRKTADDLAKFALIDPDGSVATAATLRMAQVKEVEMRQKLAQMRNSEDPLTIRNESVDRVVRGVYTIIGEELYAIFGKHMYSTTARLTRVALNQNVTPREVRAAIERRS